MNVVVCIKQVPNTTQVKIDPKTNTLIREGVESVINPFDTYAIEEGVRIKEKTGGKVIVITMGPPQAEVALREAISVGCDEAILISDRKFAGSDTWATSYTLSQAIKKVNKINPVNIILCGKQASDGDTAQVGPGIATFLNIPQITYVRRIDKIENDHLVVERLVEDGYEIINTAIPCLMTVVKEINEPRLPSLKGKIKAKSAQIIHWTAAELECDPKNIGLEGSPTKVLKIFNPPIKSNGEILKGETGEIVDKLAGILKQEISGA